ncbi:MAG TPA: sugar phosphate nucleotidyltransferase [Clostridia bacterium]
MKAIIMAGGKGTRLRPITCSMPKPMVPVMNIPLIEHIIILLKKHGITDIGVTLMFLPQKITSYFGDGTKWGVRLHYFTEEKPMGTAGSILSASSFIDDTFIIISGDCITDLDLTKVIEFHRLKQAAATLVLAREENPLNFGIVTTDNSSYITGFLEKPARGEVFSDTINTGIYVLEPEVFNHIKHDRPSDFSRDLFPELLDKGYPLVGYTSYDYWSDVGTVESYINTHCDIFNRKTESIPGKNKYRDNVIIGRSTVIEPTAKINSPCLIGSNCYIGHGAVIDSYSVIGNNCFIEDQTSIKRSILMNNCSIGRGCELRGSILGNKVRFMHYVSCYENALVGDECVVHERSIIKPNIRIWPGKIVGSLSVVDRNIVWVSRYKPELFNQDGLTGIVNVDITPEFASRLGSAYGSVMGQGTSIVVSSDDSNASSLFKYAFISGLMSVGIKVNNISEVPVPLSRHAVRMLHAAGGVHVRRSSESGDKLEIDFFDENGANADSSVAKNIESVFYKEDFLRCRAQAILDINNISSFTNYYLSNLLGKIDIGCIRRKKCPSVLIASNGESMLSFIRSIFEGLGITMGGEMLVHQMDPKNIRNVDHFLHADLTAFIDCNGEKLVLICPGGKVIDGNLFFLFTSYILLRSVPGCSIVSPLNMTSALERVANKYGGAVKRVKASKHAVLKELMKTDIYSGSINQYMLQYDAAASLAKIIEYMCRHQTTLENILKFLPSYHLVHKSVLCPFDNIGKVMRIVLSEDNTAKQLYDGIRISFKNSWVLIVPDANKPLLHIYTEGNTGREAVKLMEKYINKIKKLIRYCSGEQKS